MSEPSGAERTVLGLFLIGVSVFVGCGDAMGSWGGYAFGEDVMQSTPADERSAAEESITDANSAEEEDLDIEERELADLADQAALAALIGEKLVDQAAADAGAGKEPPVARENSVRDAGLTPKPIVEPALVSQGGDIPSARENWGLSSAECLGRLYDHRVGFERPEFETPLVQIPLLLTGPIEGVTIRPKWPRSEPTNAVMDCHLVLALVELARVARELGVVEVLFYSTYRPIVKPPKKCAEGRRGRKCRKQRRIYEQAKKDQKKSQHRYARAIDIRWLILEDGGTIDVLEHYDRRDKVDPCSYEAEGEQARLLQQLACELFERKIFNVMLTPNSNKAHHNHFHFDITPEASWNIIR